MQKKERHVKVTNGVQTNVEAIGDVSLELADGFIFYLEMFFMFFHYRET